MKYYIYITPDSQIEVRLRDYIDNNDPGFFGRNKSHIKALWELDTESPASCLEVLNALSRNRITEPVVRTFVKAVGMDVEKIKQFQQTNYPDKK